MLHPLPAPGTQIEWTALPARATLPSPWPVRTRAARSLRFASPQKLQIDAPTNTPFPSLSRFIPLAPVAALTAGLGMYGYVSKRSMPSLVAGVGEWAARACC